MNTTANDNTGVGYVALSSNITGTQNTAVGSHALDAHYTVIVMLLLDIKH